MDKKQVADILEEMGTLLELQGANPFKARAFHNGGRVLEGITEDFREAVASGSIRKVKGIGEGIARVITDLVVEGHSRDYDELRKAVPDGVLQMLRIQGLGPKRVKILFEQLQIKSVDELETAAKSGKLSTLEGFGAKTEKNILTGIDALRTHAEKSLYPVAAASAQAIFVALMKTKGVIRGEIAGSLRRKKETIGDIDLLISAGEHARDGIMRALVSHPSVESINAQGETKSSVVLKGGIQCDLRIVRDEEFPFALSYFTGSKEHNVEMRSRARKLGLSLNEYGFSKIEDGKPLPARLRRLRIRDEQDIYAALGLPYVPPELREQMGEFEAGEMGTLPNLITEQNIRGTFHCHTTYSDGVNSIEEMVSAAKKLDWDYLGIADHSKAAAYAGGLSAARLKAQVAEIDALNSRMPGFTIFKGTECDILPDGSLDWPANILALLDYVVVSVHSNFKMTQADMTKRIIKALKNRHVTMLGHPTGRLLLSRDPYPADMMAIINAAADYGKAIELNAHPMRLDLDWRLCKYAKEKGVRIFINPDAHAADGLQDVMIGVGIARKGWLEPADVVNTWEVMKVRKYFKEVTQ